MAPEDRWLHGVGAVVGTLGQSKGTMRRWQKDGSGQLDGVGELSTQFCSSIVEAGTHSDSRQRLFELE